MIKYFRMMRVHHYVKNVLIFLPCFFAGKMGNSVFLKKNLCAFIIFSFATSVVYIINDIKDKEIDKFHPIKKMRPIASGQISVKKAIETAIILFFGMFVLFFIEEINFAALGCCLLYILINLLYSFFGKNIPVLDVVLLGAGYLLRVLFGGCVSYIQVSSWLFLTVMCISFYLGLGKRHGELKKAGGGS